VSTGLFGVCTFGAVLTAGQWQSLVWSKSPIPFPSIGIEHHA
jgi:hypothetical protein